MAISETLLSTALKKEEITPVQRFRFESVLTEKFGRDGLRIYFMINGANTVGQIAAHTALDERRLLDILKLMASSGLIKVEEALLEPVSAPAKPAAQALPQPAPARLAVPLPTGTPTPPAAPLKPSPAALAEKKPFSYASPLAAATPPAQPETAQPAPQADSSAKQPGQQPPAPINAPPVEPTPEPAKPRALSYSSPLAAATPPLPKPVEPLPAVREPIPNEPPPPAETKKPGPALLSRRAEIKYDSVYQPPTTIASAVAAKIGVRLPVRKSIGLFGKLKLEAELLHHFGQKGMGLFGLINGERTDIELSKEARLRLLEVDKILEFLAKDGWIELRTLSQDELREHYGEEGIAISDVYGRDGVYIYELIDRKATIRDIIGLSGIEPMRGVEIFAFIHKVLGIDIPLDKDSLYKQLGVGQ